MRTYVDRAIVLAGHKVHGEQADTHIRMHVEQERKAGKKTLNHLLYDDGKGRRKHNFLLDGSPIIAYTYFNVLLSPLEQAVFLCDKASQKILLACEEFSKAHGLARKRFSFIDEQESFSENIFKGAQTLEALDGKHTFILSGDTPLRYDLLPAIADPDILRYDAIFDMNSQLLLGKYFPRNFHWNMEYENVIHPIKEPNGFVCDLSSLSMGLMEKIYSSRRTYDASDSRKRLIKEIFSEHWRSLLPILGEKFLIKNLPLFYKKSIEGVHLSSLQIEKIFSLVTGMDTKVKAKNHDPSTLKDVDSLEDWVYLCAMHDAAKDTYGKDRFHEVYPPAPLVKAFGKDMVRKLSEHIPMYRDFPAYINTFCDTFGIARLYEKGIFKQKLFAPHIIRNDVAEHMAYFRARSHP